MLTPFDFTVRWPTLLAKYWRARTGGPNKPCTRRRRLCFIIFRLDALGDVVLTTPFFRELKREFPDSHCTVVVQEPYRSILTTNPYVDEILTVPGMAAGAFHSKLQRLLAAVSLARTHLRGRYFDVAISPRWDVDEHFATLLSLLTNAGSRVGYTERTSLAKRQLNRGFDDAFDVCLSAGPLQHEVLRNLAVVEALGGTVEDDALEIRLSDQDRQAASRRLRGSRPASKLIALGIGAQAASRRWPLERYAQALSLLERHFQVQPVILCSQEEQEPAAELAKILHVEPILLAGAPLREVCAVLARCELFLGNDSGPAHLAAAMDCSTIVVSRHPRDGDPNHPNSPHRFAPHGRNCCVLQPDQGLGLCHESCQAPEAHCIKAVAVADVVTAALQFVSPETGSRPAVGHHVGWPVLVAPINNHQFQGTLAAR